MSHRQVFHKSFFSHENILVKVVLKVNFASLAFFKRQNTDAVFQGDIFLFPAVLNAHLMLSLCSIQSYVINDSGVSRYAELEEILFYAVLF